MLVPMQQEAFTQFRSAAIAAYAEDNITAGRWPRDGAEERSREEFDQLLPQGLATRDHYLFEITDDSSGASVGFIWLAAVEKNGVRIAYVYDVEIRPEFRRLGHARAAFQAIEPFVRSLGLSSIGLHVFGHNPGAQALYSSLGYAVTGFNMLKSLDDDRA